MWSRNSIYKVRDIRVVGIEETCGGMITLCYTPGKSLDSRLDEECIHQRTHMAVFLIITPLVGAWLEKRAQERVF